MARKHGNRVKFTTATTGTGTITVGAVYAPKYMLPADAGYVDGDEPIMVIEDGDNFEISRGVVGGGGTTITRAVVEVSKVSGSVGTSKISLSGAAAVTFVESAADFSAVENLKPATFTKADPWSVAFVRTGIGAVSLKAGTVIELAGVMYAFSVDTAVQMPTLTAGTDYAVYLCNDGSLRADASFSAPTGFTVSNSRRIGGFHYAPGGNAPAQAGGDTTPQINPYSLWDLRFRPACPDPRGMTLVAGGFWCDIYLLGVDHIINGTSRYNVTIADGASPPKIPPMFGGNGSATYASLTWWVAAEVLATAGKQLLSYDEFAASSFGTTEGSSAGTDPVSTILRQAYTSRWGVMLSSGNMWIWSREFSYRTGTGAEGWRNQTGGRGQIYLTNDTGLAAALIGGYSLSGAYSGSRASFWCLSPWDSADNIGARGRCDHLCQV